MRSRHSDGPLRDLFGLPTHFRAGCGRYWHDGCSGRLPYTAFPGTSRPANWPIVGPASQATKRLKSFGTRATGKIKHPPARPVSCDVISMCTVSSSQSRSVIRFNPLIGLLCFRIILSNLALCWGSFLPIGFPMCWMRGHTLHPSACGLRMLVCCTAKRRVCSHRGTLMLDMSNVGGLWLKTIQYSKQVFVYFEYLS